MGGRGRAVDNVTVERFWRTIKYDDIYIRGYETMDELRRGIAAFIEKYNRRKHKNLGMSSEEKYRSGMELNEAAGEETSPLVPSLFSLSLVTRGERLRRRIES